MTTTFPSDADPGSEPFAGLVDQLTQFPFQGRQIESPLAPAATVQLAQQPEPVLPSWASSSAVEGAAAALQGLPPAAPESSLLAVGTSLGWSGWLAMGLAGGLGAPSCPRCWTMA